MQRFRTRGLVRSSSFGTPSALAEALAHSAEYRTFAAGRTLEPGPHLSQIEAQLRHGAAQRVAVHAEFCGRLTLVAPVCHEHFTQILFLEFAYGLLVRNTAGVHLRHQAVQFSSHFNLFLL